jgi:tetratricopeptide (TPR) repeat protein
MRGTVLIAVLGTLALLPQTASAGEQFNPGLALARNAASAQQIQLCNTADPARAIQACSNIINSSSAPTVRSSAFTNRGLAHLRKNEAALALEDYERALELDPKNVRALVNRGNIRQLQGDSERAFADYERAILIDPKDSGAYTARADANLRRSRPDIALEDYTKRLRSIPGTSTRFSIAVRAIGSRGFSTKPSPITRRP